MRTFLRASRLAIFSVTALVVSHSPTLGATPQQADSAPPLSLDRVREGLEKAPALKVDARSERLQPVFRSRVDQRRFVPTLEEHLHKEFDLNELQRQSADWASKCCGYDLSQLVKIVHDSWQGHQIRKTREQIARELAELEAARKKTPPSDKE